jgi:hypothetical protein
MTPTLCRPVGETGWPDGQDDAAVGLPTTSTGNDDVALVALNAADGNLDHAIPSGLTVHARIDDAGPAGERPFSEIPFRVSRIATQRQTPVAAPHREKLHNPGKATDPYTLILKGVASSRK